LAEIIFHHDDGENDDGEKLPSQMSNPSLPFPRGASNKEISCPPQLLLISSSFELASSFHHLRAQVPGGGDAGGNYTIVIPSHHSVEWPCPPSSMLSILSFLSLLIVGFIITLTLTSGTLLPPPRGWKEQSPTVPD
jgi:hypothetical protein